MYRIYTLRLLICLAVSVQLAQAQTPGLTTPSAAAGRYSGEVANTNQLVLGIGATALYDSNAFNTPEGNGQAEFGATPRVSWDIAHSHWNSVFSYTANIMRSTRYDFYNQTSHSLTASFGYQFSKSLSIDVSDRFAHTAEPLYTPSELFFQQPTPGAPNPSFLGVPAILTSNFTTVSGQYRLDARSSLTIGGNYSIQRYGDMPGSLLSSSSRDSNAVSGSIAYNYSFSGRTKGGLSYDLTKFTTPIGYDTLSQRILVNAQVSPRPSMNLSVFAGPNYISNTLTSIVNGNSIPVTSVGWSWSAGGTYSWVKSRMTMSASVIRQVSDGGGLVGTVQLTSFQGSVAGKLPYKLSGSINAGYNLNDRLFLQNAGFQSPKYGSAGATLTRNLRRDLTASIAYERLEQVLGLATTAPWIDRDRVTISINYTFTHPLGR